MQKDVFISYSRKDTAIADQICAAFDEVGITYFIDREGIGGGMEFPEVLADQIIESKLFLFLASKNSYASKFTKSEIAFAFNEKPKNSLLPYIIDGSELPRSLRFTFSGINWRNISEHPIETILTDDVLRLLGKIRSQKQVLVSQTQSMILTLKYGIYEGEVLNGEPHGRGKLTYNEGKDNKFEIVSYEGEWENGVKMGKGTMLWKSGHRYEGCWIDGHRTFGAFYYTDGDCYEGNWKDGERNGLGKYYYSNGDCVKGNYVDNKREGEHYYYKKDEQRPSEMRIYKNGVRVTSLSLFEATARICKMLSFPRLIEGTMWFKDGVYTGQIRCGRPHGKGRLVYNEDKSCNILFYEGEWQDGCKCGKGIMKWEDGEFYEGEWQNDSRNGQGTYYLQNGDCKVGNYINGKAEGKFYLYKRGEVKPSEIHTYKEGQWVNQDVIYENLM